MPDAFDLLGVDARFNLTPGEVRAAYLAKARSRGGDAGAEESEDAALNAAKMALSDPEARANLLLARLGGPSKEVNRGLPDGFLMSMMEAREELEAAAARRDSAGIEKWRVWAERERDGHVARVGALFGGTGGRPDGKTLAAIRQELNAWRYIERMLEQIGEL
ncbi:MAG TPA: iron-sulfur cluster co-chaperone HscB C-terminal domain-containing protein [Phycisphaerales bacterium]|nr:iron-sulfur cluster co-chaperone HscB C-terminal domain-containing protein [Phycisphaerales bacterium]